MVQIKANKTYMKNARLVAHAINNIQNERFSGFHLFSTEPTLTMLRLESNKDEEEYYNIKSNDEK